VQPTNCGGDMIYSYGFSIVHTKEVWRETPYPAVNWGEDQGFLQIIKLKGNKLAFYRDTTCICVHIQHGRNASRSVANSLVEREFILNSPVGPCLPHKLRTILEGGEIESEHAGGTHRGLFVCDIDGGGAEQPQIDDKKKLILKQWVGLELARCPEHCWHILLGLSGKKGWCRSKGRT